MIGKKTVESVKVKRSGKSSKFNYSWNLIKSKLEPGKYDLKAIKNLIVSIPGDLEFEDRKVLRYFRMLCVSRTVKNKNLSSNVYARLWSLVKSPEVVIE